MFGPQPQKAVIYWFLSAYNVASNGNNNKRSRLFKKMFSLISPPGGTKAVELSVRWKHKGKKAVPADLKSPQDTKQNTWPGEEGQRSCESFEGVPTPDADAARLWCQHVMPTRGSPTGSWEVYHRQMGCNKLCCQSWGSIHIEAMPKMIAGPKQTNDLSQQNILSGRTHTCVCVCVLTWRLKLGLYSLPKEEPLSRPWFVSTNKCLGPVLAMPVQHGESSLPSHFWSVLWSYLSSW